MTALKRKTRRTNYRIRRLRLSRLLLGQETRHPSSRIIRTFGRMRQLTPSFLRSSMKVGIGVALVFLAEYVRSGYFDHKWWSADYIWSCAIPVSLAPVIIWFMFVPRRLEYSESEFSITNRMARDFNAPWSRLQYYGPGNNVFMIQFEGRQAFQIFAFAFPKEEWNEFALFLTDRFPNKKATGSIFGRLFRWKK